MQQQKKFNDYPEFIKVKDLKVLFGIGLRQTYELVKTKEFNKMVCKESGLFDKSKIVKWLISKKRLNKCEVEQCDLDPFPEFQDVLCVNDLRNLLGVGREKAYEMVRQGYIRSRRVGDRYLIHKYNVVCFLNDSK
jgi:excisionase family DNA binding protein